MSRALELLEDIRHSVEAVAQDHREADGDRSLTNALISLAALRSLLESQPSEEMVEKVAQIIAVVLRSAHDRGAEGCPVLYEEEARGIATGILGSIGLPAPSVSEREFRRLLTALEFIRHAESNEEAAQIAGEAIEESEATLARLRSPAPSESTSVALARAMAWESGVNFDRIDTKERSEWDLRATRVLRRMTSQSQPASPESQP